MDDNKLAKLAKQLNSPLGFRRLSAVKALAADTSRARVPILAKALEHKDKQVRQAAIQALTEPVTPEVLPALALAIEQEDRDVAEAAWNALARLKDPVLVDGVAQLAIQRPEGRLGNLCRKAKFRHTDDALNCVYLLVTGQIDDYFGKYFDDFQHTRRAYEKGDQALRANIMRVVQSGDRRFQDFFRKGQRRHERGEEDILLEINSSLRLQDWAQLFELFLEAPMKYGYPLLELFRRSGWEPPEAPAGADAQTKSRAEARRSLYREALRLSAGNAVEPKPVAEDTGGPVTPVTLEIGGTHSGSVASLMQQLEKVNPIEAIPIVAAIARQGDVDAATRQKIQNHEHWPIRLAGRLSGLCPASAFANDPVHWVREGIPLATTSMSTALELWPSRATPDDVQHMNALPPQAFEGKLGAVRGVLRLIITSGVKAAIVEKDQAVARQQAAVVDEED